MRFCFIILHYRKLEETARCIDSVLRMTDSRQMQIVVVDNSMDDDSGQVIAEQYCSYENVHVIPSEKNAGFSRANNIGYQYALEHFTPDFVVAVNNDIEFLQQDFKTQVEQIYEKTPFAVLGPDVIHAATGGHQSPIDLTLRSIEEAESTIKKNRIALKLSGILFPLFNLILTRGYENRGNRLAIDYEKQHKDVVLLGACLIFSKKFIGCCEQAFYPETDFFYEEYIMACRLERLGMCIIYDPAIKVRHESGAAIRHSYKDRKKKLQFVLKNTMKGCQVYLEYRKGEAL